VDDDKPATGDQHPTEAEDTAQVSLTDPARSRCVGPYRVLQKLGEGGMGEVWLAEQTEPVRRRVALKIIKRGMDTNQVIARFEAERQALALMDHPCVARVFDAGSTANGRPFFAMEYIKGVPITEHCDRQKLNTPERLELFQRVCEGVQHAHQKAIIHRDLKPSNVLVTESGGERTPKIIDFGVAKATGQRLTEKTLFTELGVLIGTPEYMSPEQAEMTGEDVDTRTDVYSLGVMLYELLTGALPFDSKELREAGFEGIRSKIREEEPSRPSTRVSTLGDRATESAKRRKTDPSTLQRLLRGDLDWIVMKSLEKDRARRYGSTSELAADLERHLKHQPVLAGPPSMAYWVGKFLRRHRVGVAAAAVLTLGLVAGVIGTTLGLVRAKRAAETSERVSEFLTQTLGTVDPYRLGIALRQDFAERIRESAEGRGLSTEEVSARLDALVGVNTTDAGLRLIEDEILARAGERIDDAFAGDPLLAARLEHSLGLTYKSLDMLEAAERHSRRAVEIRERELGRDDPVTLRSMNNLANVYVSLRRRDEAIALTLETFETRKRVLGEEHPDTLISMHNLGNVYQRQGRLDDAETLLLNTLGARRRVLGGEHELTLSTMNLLGILYDKQRRFDEAEEIYRDTLDARRRTLGDRHRDTLQSIHNLALRYQRSLKPGAEPLYVEAIETGREVLGSEHPSTLISMQNLVNLYVRQKRYEKARRLATLWLTAQKRRAEASLDAEPSNYFAWHALTCQPEDLQDPTAALRFAIVANERSNYENPQHLDTLALAYQRTGEAVRAIEIAKKALALIPEGETGRANMEWRLADLYASAGQYDEAESLLLATLRQLVETRSDGDRWTNTARSNLINFYADNGDYEKARPHVLEQLESLRDLASETNDVHVANLYAWMALTCEPADLQDPESALEFALKANEKTGHNNPVYLDTLALAYYRTGDTVKAIETEKKAIALTAEEETATRGEYRQRLVEFEAALDGVE